MNETNLKITGMMCQACVAHVTKTLEAIPGVRRAVVTLEPGQAVVESAGVDPQILATAVRAEDYEVEVG